MEYKVLLTDQAQKSLASLSEPIRERVVRVLKLLRENPRRPGSKKLKAKNYLHRVHAGRDYVILYQIEDQIVTVLVVRIANRKDAYRNLPERVTKI